MLNFYYTVKQSGSHEIVIQKSRFIAHIQRAETEEEALQFIQKIKKEHWNATHNCSAYIIGKNDEIQKANDDGEPSGTAGVPMLEVLKKRKLKNTAVVVTRYFGGIKLGASGLIRAYSQATSEGLDAVGIVERKLVHTMKVNVDYHWLGKVENELRQSPYLIKEIEYLEDVTIHTYVPVEKLEEFVEWVTNITNGQAAVTKGETHYLETDV